MGRGKLVFKGDEGKSSIKSHKRRRKNADDLNHDTEESVATSVILDHRTDSHDHGESLQSSCSTPMTTTTPLDSTRPAVPVIQNGTGLIVTSGSVVSGINTKFRRELNVGDAILVRLAPDPEADNSISKINNEEQHQEEMRVITICLSDTSCNVSSAFTRSHSTPIEFRCIRKPRNITHREVTRQKEMSEKARRDEEQRAGGVYTTLAGESTAPELVYHEKMGGSYRIKREILVGAKDVSRTGLMEMRSKKKSDKYC
jgi:hypothetical protein